MKALSLVFGCCVLMLTATAFGQATLYTVPAEYTVTECNEIVEFEVWTNSSNGSNVRAWQVWFDCIGPDGTMDAPCPAAGTVEYVMVPKSCVQNWDCAIGDTCVGGFCATTLQGPEVDDSRSDYIFFGITHVAPTEHNGECDNPEYDPFTHGTRAANAATYWYEYPIVSTPKYLCTWKFQATQDASGDFVLDWYCDANDGCSGDRTAILDDTNTPIEPLVSTPLIVHVPCGQCCDGTTCIDETTQCECDKLGGTWNDNKTCADDCMCFTNADCNDSNPCTNDTCVDGTCYNDPVDCSGAGDVCNTASCDMGGAPGNCAILTPKPDGTTCTNDGDPCTTDECIAGVCVHTPIEDCAIVVCLEAEAAGRGAKPVDCVPAGGDLLVRVHIGGGGGIVGHQARVEWDKDSLTLIDIQPGAFCDPMSEFTGFLAPPVMGKDWVFFAAETGIPVPCVVNEDCPGFPDWQTCDTGVGLCTPVAESSDGNVDTACLYFAMSGCDPTQVCFCEHNNDYDPQACNPYKMRVVTETGGQLPWQACDPPCANPVPDTPIELTCPDDINVNAECDDVTADIFWDAPAATDECGEAEIVSYTCTPLAGSPACQQAWIDNNGGTFPQGSWLFQVCAMDMECEDEACCSWTVTVSSDQTLEVEVQLSPVVDPGPFTRCIEFQLWTACTPLIVGLPFYEPMTFGGDYYVAGHGAAIIKIPKGQYECIAARDPLHTLRASADVECDGVVYRAIFKGDPFLGGNWLIGGNLDGLRPKDQGSPHTIDIVDYAIFVAQYLTNVGANTDCSPAMLDPTFMHADVNGDGFVDDLDFTFISINFLESDKDVCCPDGRVAPVGLTEVTTRQLRAWGIDDKADMNGDGLVNTEDMQLFLGGIKNGSRSGR